MTKNILPFYVQGASDTLDVTGLKVYSLMEVMMMIIIIMKEMSTKRLPCGSKR